MYYFDVGSIHSLHLIIYFNLKKVNSDYLYDVQVHSLKRPISLFNYLGTTLYKSHFYVVVVHASFFNRKKKY